MSASLRSRLIRLRDPARQAVQTMTAAVATFAVMTFAGLPEISWAVISALLVVQPSVGGTIGTVFGRLLGTALGTAVGLACVFLIGSEGWRAAASLAVAALAVEAVAGVRPGIRYGHVPAGILIVASASGGLLDSAFDRALAIGIGAAIAAVAALTVFPEPAHRRADRHLAAALRRCADLLSGALSELLARGQDARLDAIHEDIRRHLDGALAMIRESRRRRVGDRKAGPEYDALLHATQRLWHTLIMIDRIDISPLPDAPRRHLERPLHALASASCDYLRELGKAVAGERAPPPPEEVRRHLSALAERLEDVRARGVTRPLPSGAAERVFSLAFALEQLGANFDEIARLFGAEPAEPRERAA